MRGEFRLATEFDAFGFGVGPAPRRALGDAAAFALRRDAKGKLGKIGRGIDNRLGNRTQARAGAGGPIWRRPSRTRGISA
jgi:hypothetical protein